MSTNKFICTIFVHSHATEGGFLQAQPCIINTLGNDLNLMVLDDFYEYLDNYFFEDSKISELDRAYTVVFSYHVWERGGEFEIESCEMLDIEE